MCVYKTVITPSCICVSRFESCSESVKRPDSYDSFKKNRKSVECQDKCLNGLTKISFLTKILTAKSMYTCHVTGKTSDCGIRHFSYSESTVLNDSDLVFGVYRF